VRKNERETRRGERRQLSGTPTPSEREGAVEGTRRYNPSRRLAQTLYQQDVKGERAIALAQGTVALLAIFAYGEMHALSGLLSWGTLALVALITSSALRWFLTKRKELPERLLDALNVFDVLAVLTLIWTYHLDIDSDGHVVIRPPAFAILLLIVSVRALRLHPRPVAIAGLVALAGWSMFVCLSPLTVTSVTAVSDIRSYLAALYDLQSAELVRILLLAGLILILAGGAFKARRIFGRAAHATDYGEALEAAQQHLQESTKAREQAESALAALDRRDAELSEQNRLFNAALENMTQGLCMFDEDQKLLVCNERYIEMYGLSKELARRGTPFRKIVESRIETGLYGGGDPAAYLEERLASAREAVRNTRLHELGDGRVIAITHEPMQGGGWVATHDDVTELRRIEAKLSHLARHDPLTDLPNRTQLRERMEQALSGDALEGSHLVVVLFEIDRFKEINDTYGPSIGDALLQAVAQRLRRRLEGVDMLARVGGDEFVVLQLSDEPFKAADALVKRLHQVLGTSFDIDEQSVTITINLGVAVGPNDGKDADELLKHADLAHGRAKKDGPGNSRFFERELDERLRARHKLEHDMRVALREGQFELYYQPQLDLAHNEIAAFEALLRWNHPERGIMPPSEFVGLAEDTGLIVQLGEWALREACEEASRWPKNVRVAVNLSVAQFRSGHVRQSVIQALGASSLSPSRLDLEITESVLMQEGTEVAAALGKLQALGIGISLDDFGTGFSSLGYLTRLRFDKIKIDKHFISELRDEPNSALAVLRSVVALSKSLGITTVAEGIETKEQLERVRAEGCDEAQGFYVGRPVPAGEVAALLARQRPRRQRQSRAS
jgi:diguanylate cyclase (GGDEF)-like protein/PAS domain S-box-containing protein